MARETQKQIIERLTLEIESLTKEVETYKKLSINQNSEILKLTNRADEVFQDSSDYKQMVKKIDFLEKKNKNLENKITKTEKIQKLKDEKKHNERGAGRKSKFTEQEMETMKLYRLQGMTIKEIAEMYECSVGLVHSVISGMKQVKPLTHEELLENFKKVNTSVKVVNWMPLINDDCEAYANMSQPRIKVILEDGDWLRVYISKEYDDITWY